MLCSTQLPAPSPGAWGKTHNGDLEDPYASVPLTEKKKVVERGVGGKVSGLRARRSAMWDWFVLLLRQPSAFTSFSPLERRNLLFPTTPWTLDVEGNHF